MATMFTINSGPLGNKPGGPLVLQRQNPHILFGFGGEGQCLTVVLSISRFYPGKDVVCDDVTGVVSQFGASTFKVGEVVSDVVLKALEGLWQAFVECVMNLSVVVIDRKMTKQMVFEVIDGVQPYKVDPNGMMEILKIYTET